MIQQPNAAILLAAGLSRRMGAGNKLLLPDVSGLSLVRRSAQCLLQLCPRVIVVVSDPQVAESLADLDVALVNNTSPEKGQALSAYLGVTALCRCDNGGSDSLGVGLETAGSLIALADQPRLSLDLLQAMWKAYDTSYDALVPCYQGRWGNPRILSPAFLRRWYTFGPNFNPRQVLRHDAYVQCWVTDDSAVIHDVDTIEDYQNWLQSAENKR